MMIFLSFFLFLGAALFGELSGIVLIRAEDGLLSTEELEELDGVHAFGVDFPGSHSELECDLTPLYFEQEWEPETISAIKKGIYRYYQQRRRPFIVVTVPDQDESWGILQVIVEESKLGKIDVVGNKWIASKRLKKYIHLTSGEPISLRRITQDINFINRNPYRFVDVIYGPGEEPNTTDLTLKVTTRRQYRFYTGFDNTGVLSTGRQRVFAGFSWDQVFGFDHVFSYQYTTNYHVKKFHANTFQYMALLPFEAILNLYGGFSIVHADISSPNKQNKGTNIQASVRYEMPLTPYDFYSHETKLGFDLKNTNNNMAFVDFTPTFGQTVNLSQFLLGYLGKYEKDQKSIEGEFDLVFSPAEWLPGQTNQDFNSLRPSAKNRWVYATAFIKLKGPLSHSFSYLLFINGQISSQVLLPSEQLGIGGYSSVRGYEERQFNADTGLTGSLEIHSPPFSIFRRKQPNQDQMYFLLFADGGWGLDKVSVPQVQPREYLIGVGPGVRYNFGSYLTARCDWGIKLHHKDSFTGGASMIHFSVIGSF
jgi:hemolysin activation/secretion protein